MALIKKIFFLSFSCYIIIFSVDSDLASMILPQELMAILNDANDKKSCLILNVLSPKIFSDCYIPRSINIPVHCLLKPAHRLYKKVQAWPRDRKIVVYCAGGDCPLSYHAYEYLKKLNFQDVKILEGGIRSWKKDGLPTIGSCRAGYLCE